MIWGIRLEYGADCRGEAIELCRIAFVAWWSPGWFRYLSRQPVGAIASRLDHTLIRRVSVKTQICDSSVVLLRQSKSRQAGRSRAASGGKLVRSCPRGGEDGYARECTFHLTGTVNCEISLGLSSAITSISLSLRRGVCLVVYSFSTPTRGSKCFRSGSNTSRPSPLEPANKSPPVRLSQDTRVAIGLGWPNANPRTLRL
jgi:hypothetical protein